MWKLFPGLVVNLYMAADSKLQAKVLFISDSSEIAGLFRTLPDRVVRNCVLLNVDSNEKAMEMLQFRSKHFIDLIFSDYLGQSSLELLDHVKNDAFLKRTPCIFFLKDEKPLASLYQHKANCCVVYHEDIATFEMLAERALQYWMEVVALPDGVSKY